VAFDFSGDTPPVTEAPDGETKWHPRPARGLARRERCRRWTPYKDASVLALTSVIQAWAPPQQVRGLLQPESLAECPGMPEL